MFSLLMSTSRLDNSLLSMSGGNACWPTVRVFNDTWTRPVFRSISQRASSRASFGRTDSLRVREIASASREGGLSFTYCDQFLPSIGLAASGSSSAALTVRFVVFARFVFFAAFAGFFFAGDIYLFTSIPIFLETRQAAFH